MIIAEFCQNHNGDLNVLKEMVYKAKEAGAHFAKIQSFFADDLSDEWKHDYDRLKSLELDWEVHAKFSQWCREVGIEPMTSVYTFDYAEKLHSSGFKYIKIGSAQSTNENLIKKYITTGFKVLISTGGHHILDIPKIGPLAGIFHCVSRYPHSPYQAGLVRMLEFKRWYGNGTPLGFSDHTDPLHRAWCDASISALCLGATFIERHFTVLDRDKTKDGKVSIDFEQLKYLCWFDRLDVDEKFKRMPEYVGIFTLPKTKEEIDLINGYKKGGRMNPNKITIHCSASKNGKLYPAKDIKKFHVEKRKMKDIGYHYVIQPNGFVEAGRDPDTMGAHVLGHNEDNIGICLIGTDKFTFDQFNALGDLLHVLLPTYEIEPWEIYAHHEFDTAKQQGKTCPNIRISNLTAWLLTGNKDVLSDYLLEGI